MLVAILLEQISQPIHGVGALREFGLPVEF